MPIDAADSLVEAARPIHVKLAKVQIFSLLAIAACGQVSLARAYELISDGLACFRVVAEAGCIHQSVYANGRHGSDLPCFS